MFQVSKKAGLRGLRHVPLARCCPSVIAPSVPAAARPPAASASTAAAVPTARTAATLPRSSLVRPRELRLRPFSTPSAIQKQTDSYCRRNAVVSSAFVLEPSRAVLVQWEDGHTSQYDFVWLRVNCPSLLHESGERTVFPGDVDPELRPAEVRNR